MERPAPQQRREAPVIDLVSDDDSSVEAHHVPHPGPVIDMDSDSDSVTYGTPPMRSETPNSDVMEHLPSTTLPNSNRNLGGSIIIVDDEEIFIPDEDALFEIGANTSSGVDVTRDREIALALDHSQAVTADDCLQRVLEIFPDISHDFVYNLYNEFDREGDYETLPGSARLDNIIEQLVSSSSYPKQDKGKKRKRQDSIEEDPEMQWANENRHSLLSSFKGPMQAMLKAEFPDIPVQYINDTLALHRHLYQTFIALAKAKDDSNSGSRPYGRGRPSVKQLAGANVIATNNWPALLDELNAARKRVQIMRSERAAEAAKKIAEEENLKHAIDAGMTSECSACFDDLPMNRQIHCDGPVAHFTCFECAETYVKSEVGESRCRVVCPAGCGAAFAYHQLNLLSDKQSLEKLLQLQQEKDIRDAGLDDLEECPFCDYKAILPPVDQDFEFRCANPECERVSCRRCKAVSHIPVSCEQHAKDNKVNSRHKIEEAMTAALVRSCNKCKKQFIKEYGCNKMTCPSCGNLQCYVCSTTLKDYNHFDQNYPGRPGTAHKSKSCPLYDNVEERHEREVKEAEATARAQVVEENPDVSAEDLEIKVSEAVRNATTDRIRRSGPGGMAAYGGPAIVPGAFGVFGAREPDRIPLDFLDFEAGRPPGHRHHQHRAADHRRRRDADLVANLNQLNANLNQLNELRRLGGANPPPVPFAHQPVQHGLPGLAQGFVPALELQPAQPAGPQLGPAAAAPIAHGLAQPGLQQRIRPPHFGPDRQFHNAFDLGGDGARDLNNAALFDQFRPGNNVPHRQADEPALFNWFGQGNNAAQAQAPGMNGFANRLGVQPQAAGGAVHGQQAFNPGIRDQRQNFQQLEMLRQQHRQQMLQRQYLYHQAHPGQPEFGNEQQQGPDLQRLLTARLQQQYHDGAREHRD